MATLTKAQRRELSGILADMKRTQAVIACDRIAVCRIEDKATTTIHHTRAYVPGVDRSPDDARPLYRVAKDIGSDLCRLPDAIRNLERLLTA